MGSNSLPLILMAALARWYSIRVFRDLVIHQLKPSPLANLSTVFRRLFGLISWFFRLHRKDLTSCGIDANFFGVFRSGFRNINGPEALS